VTWTRRRFLASSATICAGAAIVGDAGEPLLSRRNKIRVRLLTSRGRVPSAAFERGVHAALSGVAFHIDALTMPVPADLADWRALVASIRGGVVLGVVTASEFVLVNELIREAGARLLYQGEHTIDDAGSARHASMTFGASIGVGASMSRSPAGWPDALGFALARAVVHRWEPAAMMTETLAGQVGGPVGASCVSFAFTA
jgi:hypothetical protein